MENETIINKMRKKLDDIMKTNQDKEKTKEAKKVEEIKKQESMTIKEWFIEKFKEGKNSKDAMCEFQKINERLLTKMIENTRQAKNKIYNIPDEIKTKFEKFWTFERKELEHKFISSKLALQINKSKPTIFINPGFGFEDPGASIGIDNTRDLNAEICEKVIKEISIEGNYEIYVAFNLKYAGIDLKKYNGVHIMFDERPPILGNSGEAKVYEASAECMRAVAEKILKNKDSKFFSICLHTDYSDNKKDVGFKVYYQVDKYTSKKFQDNSKILSNELYKSCTDIFKVSETEGVEIKDHIIERDLAMANLGEMALKEEFKNSNAGAVVVYFGYISNKAQLEKLKQEELQNKAARAVNKSLTKFIRNNKIKF